MLQLFFYLFAAITVGGALFVLFSKNILYSAFALMTTLLGVAGLYVFAVADFLAVAQIMVYVGGILVLLLFGVMFTNRQRDGQLLTPVGNRLLGGGMAVALLVVLLNALALVDWDQLPWVRQALEKGQVVEASTVRPVGQLLMTHYVVAFELAGLLLLLALIGAATIAGGKQEAGDQKKVQV